MTTQTFHVALPDGTYAIRTTQTMPYTHALVYVTSAADHRAYLLRQEARWERDAIRLAADAAAEDLRPTVGCTVEEYRAILVKAAAKAERNLAAVRSELAKPATEVWGAFSWHTSEALAYKAAAASRARTFSTKVLPAVAGKAPKPTTTTTQEEPTVAAKPKPTTNSLSALLPGGAPKARKAAAKPAKAKAAAKPEPKPEPKPAAVARGTKATQAKALRNLTAQAAKLQALTAAYEAAVVAALDAGLSQRAVGEAAGMSHVGVAKLRQRVG